MGCSNNPENIENTTNNQNNEKEITENTPNQTDRSEIKKLTNPLQLSKSTNLQTSIRTFKKSKTSYTRKKPKISPFTISTMKSNGINDIYLVKVNASVFLKEELIPIWFDKDTYVKFITKANWRIDRKYNFTDSRGMPSNNAMEFNYGAAIARIGSGSKFLLIPNDLTYYNKFEGPLYLRMNLPKNMDVYPEGTMEIKIFDGILMTIEEINSKIGWKEKDMSYASKKSTDLENKLTKDINSLRMNPILFYETYQKSLSSNIWTEDFLKNIKNINDNNQISSFASNNDLYIYLKEFTRSNYDAIKNNLNKRGIDKYMEKLKNLISISIKEKFGCENLVDCRKTKKIKSEEICMLYILDTEFRQNIFYSEYYSIAINILDDIIPGDIFIILVLMKD